MVSSFKVSYVGLQLTCNFSAGDEVQKQKEKKRISAFCLLACHASLLAHGKRLPCRAQLEKEKKRREAVEKEKDQMEREKKDITMRLYQFEEKIRKAEHGGDHSKKAGHTSSPPIIFILDIFQICRSRHRGP